MTLSLRLAQIEGGLVTLEQYSPEIIRSVAAEQAAQAAAEKGVTPPQPEDTPEENSRTIGHEELMEQSPTYRKSVEKEQMKAKAKKKGKS